VKQKRGNEEEKRRKEKRRANGEVSEQRASHPRILAQLEWQQREWRGCGGRRGIRWSERRLARRGIVPQAQGKHYGGNRPRCRA